MRLKRLPPGVPQGHGRAVLHWTETINTPEIIIIGHVVDTIGTRVASTMHDTRRALVTWCPIRYSLGLTRLLLATRLGDVGQYPKLDRAAGGLSYVYAAFTNKTGVRV